MSRTAAWIGFVAMSIGMFMAILDIQIVASSLPDIQAGLLIPRPLLDWVQTSYLIAEVIAVMLSGCLTPVLSTGGLFVAAVSGFTLFSIGCAFSSSWPVLILFRTLQGFCGGAIIPTVFSAGYKLFPPQLQPRATLIAGSLAVLAPTLGPCVGGYITDRYDWPWLFLINVIPGIVVAAVAAALIRIDKPDFARFRQIDLRAAVSFSVTLASIELLVQQAPEDGWFGPRSLGYATVILISGWFGFKCCRRHPQPLITLTLFSDRRFFGACALSFVFGGGLYGSVYLLPLFLGFVRNHTALDIGLIMTAMGVAQILTAPIAAFADSRWPAAWVGAIGMILFASGMLANGFETPRSDASALFWPQILRGCGVLLVMLPLTSVALSSQHSGDLAQASALINLFRNLGGAIGIAIADTIVIVRAPHFAQTIAHRLADGSRDTARFVGLPLDRFHDRPLGPVSAEDRDFAQPLVEQAAATLAFNEAWLVLGGATLLALALIPLLRADRRNLL